MNATPAQMMISAITPAIQKAFGETTNTKQAAEDTSLQDMIDSRILYHLEKMGMMKMKHCCHHREEYEEPEEEEEASGAVKFWMNLDKVKEWKTTSEKRAEISKLFPKANAHQQAIILELSEDTSLKRHAEKLSMTREKMIESLEPLM